MNTIIDKVKVFTLNFSIHQIETFGVQSHNKQPNEPISQSPCCFLENGTPIIGQNAYINSVGDIPYQLNIKMNEGTPMAWLTFNPSRFGGGLNEAITLIYWDLKERHKFEFDFDSSKLSRVDMAKDNEMERLAREYHEAKRHLAKARYYRDATTFPDSLLFKTGGKNPLWEVSDYDKGKKNELDEGNKKPNSTKLLRSELRLCTPKYVNIHLGFSGLTTLQELNQSELNSFYTNTQLKFLQELNDKKQKPQSSESVGDILARMPELMLIRSHKEKIHRYFIGLNSELEIVTARHNFIEAFLHHIDTEMTFTSKQSKSNLKASILKHLDIEIRKANADKQKNKAQMDKSLPDRIEEYTYKFLTA